MTVSYVLSDTMTMTHISVLNQSFVYAPLHLES
jgi:hypothetical protein